MRNTRTRRRECQRDVSKEKAVPARPRGLRWWEPEELGAEERGGEIWVSEAHPPRAAGVTADAGHRVALR